MHYRIRRVTLGSALRVALALGWLVAIGPAMCIAVLAVRVLTRVSAAFAQIEPIEVSVLGRLIARFDILERLQLASTAQTIAEMAQHPTNTFVIFTLLLTLVGAIAILVVALLFCLGYNLLAGVGGGLEVELDTTD